MANNLNVSVLCAAKEEYTNQLKHYLTPLIQEGFVSIYDDAVINDDTGNVLRQFQIYLKQIPRWNQTILEQETKRIKDKCPFLMDLVTAIFVSHVKILASVRLGGNHNNIKIKIPTSEIFIHSVYVNSAEKFYYEPQPFADLLKRKNVDLVKDTIDETIEETISTMIPIQSILQEYLSSAFSEHTKPQPMPDPEPELPTSRELGGMDMVDSPPPNDVGFSSFGTSGSLGGEGFPIGDQPTFSQKIGTTLEKLPLDLGETLDATSTGNPENAGDDNDSAFGSAFSPDNDCGSSVASIPSEPIFNENEDKEITNPFVETVREKEIDFTPQEPTNDEMGTLGTSPARETLGLDEFKLESPSNDFSFFDTDNALEV